MPLGIADTERVRAFLQAQYGERYYGADARYFDWLYRQSPCEWFAPERARGRLPANAVLNDDGTLGAVHTFVPFDAWTPWRGSAGIWDIEWITRMTRRGVGRALAAHLLSRVDVYAAYGCNELSVAAFQRLGMRIIPEVHRRVIVFELGRLDVALHQAGIVNASGSSGSPDVRDVHFDVLPEAKHVSPTALADYAARTPFGASRTPEWLAWRYDRHPFVAYSTVSAEGGAAILRIEFATGSDVRVCRMLEFFPVDGGEAPLLAASIAFARANDALLLDHFATSRSHADLFSRAGIQLGARVMDNPSLPYLFQPLAQTSASAMNMVIAAEGRTVGGVDLTTFQAGKGDANQDILRDPTTAPRSNV